MKNIFSANEPQPEINPVFEQQAQQQRGTHPTAPTSVPALEVPLVSPPINPMHPTIAKELPHPDFESLSRRSAPGSAKSSDLTYVWRK